jgi:putative transposase
MLNLVGSDHKRKLPMVDPNSQILTITRQTELLEISRSSYYYTPVQDSNEDMLLKRLDEIYTEYPFFGSRRMSVILKKEGYDIGRYKVIRLMNRL